MALKHPGASAHQIATSIHGTFIQVLALTRRRSELRLERVKMPFDSNIVHFAAYFNKICQKVYSDSKVSTSHCGVASGGSIAIICTDAWYLGILPCWASNLPQEWLQQASVSTTRLLGATPNISASTIHVWSLDLALLGVPPTGLQQRCSLSVGRLRCSSIAARIQAHQIRRPGCDGESNAGQNFSTLLPKSRLTERGTKLCLG